MANRFSNIGATTTGGNRFSTLLPGTRTEEPKLKVTQAQPQETLRVVDKPPQPDLKVIESGAVGPAKPLPKPVELISPKGSTLEVREVPPLPDLKVTDKPSPTGQIFDPQRALPSEVTQPVAKPTTRDLNRFADLKVVGVDRTKPPVPPLDEPNKIAQFLARTTVSFADLTTEFGDFAFNFMTNRIVDVLELGAKTTGDERQKKVAENWQRFFNQQVKKGTTPTRALKQAVDRIEQLKYLQPTQAWQQADIKEKLTTRLGETLLNIGPSIISSLGVFAINPVMGFSVISGATANDVKENALTYGVDETTAELLGASTGILVGMLERIVPGKIFKGGGIKNKFLGNFARRLTNTALLETGTEIAQEDIQLIAEKVFRDDLGWDEVVTRNALAGLGGLLGGAGVQTVASFANNVQRQEILQSLGKIPVGLTIQARFNPKIMELQNKWQELQERKVQLFDQGLKETHSSVKNIIRAQDIIERQVRREAQAGFVKVPGLAEDFDLSPIRETGKAKEGKTAFKNLEILNAKVTAELEHFVENVRALKQAEIAHPVTDGREVGILPSTAKDVGSIDVLLNFQRTKKIIEDHGSLPENALVDTVNKPDLIISQPGVKGDKLDIIKVYGNDFVIAGALKINGFATLTFFQSPTKQNDKQKYLQSVLNRGTVVYSTGEAAVRLTKSGISHEVVARLQPPQRAFPVVDRTVDSVSQKKKPVKPLERKGVKGKIAESIRPRPGEITKREDVALRDRIRAEARGARVGFKAGTIEMRAQLLEAMRTKRAEIKDIKQQIINFAREILPPAERGKLLTAVKNAKTRRDLIKAFVKIDAIYEENIKKDLVKEIKKIGTKLPSTIAVDYRNQIEAIMNTIQFKGKNEETVERLNKTKQFIEQQQELGRDITIPEGVLQQLKILERVPVSELSVPQLQNILREIEVLIELGKTKQKARQNLETIRKEKMFNELEEEIVPIDSHPMFRAPVGEQLTLKERLANRFHSFLGFWQHIDLSITPMDVIFDLLGGGDGSYNGAPFRIFKQTTDNNYQEYLNQKDKISVSAWQKVEDLGLDRQNFERIGIHAARIQRNGREKLINAGLTLEEIDSVKLNFQEMEFYQFMRKQLDDLRQPIAEIMRVVYNKNLGLVEDYFPFMTDWKAMSDTEIFMRIGEQVEEIGQPLKKTVEMGFTKERTKVSGKQPIKIDAMEVYLKHIDNVSYLLNIGRDNKMLFEIANNERFKNIAGDLGQEVVLQWLDLIARKGGGHGEQQIPVLDMLRRNIGVGVLGLKLSSAIIQPTALMDGGSLIGTWAFRGLNKIVTEKEARQFVLDNMSELRNRVADDPAFIELSEDKRLKKVQEFGMKPLKILDAITASSVAIGAYMQKLKELNLELDYSKPNQEAIEYAQKIVRRTQSTGIFKDVPLAITKGSLTGNKSFDKALLQFQNFMLNRWSLIRHDLYRAGIKEKDFGKAFQIFFWLSLAVLTEEGLRRASKELIGFITGKEDDEDDGYTKRVAMSVLTTIPFVSGIVSIGVYNGNPIPSLSVADALVQGGVQFVTGKKPETKLKGLVRLAESAGSLVGIPGSRQTGQIVRDSLEEKTKKSSNRLPELPKLPKLPALPKL